MQPIFVALLLVSDHFEFMDDFKKFEKYLGHKINTEKTYLNQMNFSTKFHIKI